MRRVIGATLPLALLISGCGTLEVVQSKTEDLVRNFELTETGKHVTNVTCPSGVRAKAGNAFDCHFLARGGAKYTAHLLIKQVHGTRVLYQISTFPTR